MNTIRFTMHLGGRNKPQARPASTLLLAALLLTACDAKHLEALPNAMTQSELERSTVSITCITQQEVRNRSSIALQGTEKIVVVTGVLSQGEIDESKAQLQNATRAPAAALQQITGNLPDCESIGHKVFQLGTAAVSASNR